MRRWGALAFLAGAATAAFADPPPAEAVRAARDAVAAMPEFRYDDPADRSFLEEWFDAFGEGLQDFAADHPALAVAALLLMVLLLLAIVAHGVWTLRMARRAAWESEAPGDLDAAIRRGDAAPFRARAVAAAAEGRFDDAVRDLYTALLLTLDRRGALRYASHKALLDYRIEAARDAGAAAALERFAGVYHPGSFGRRPPDRAHFDALLADLDAFAGRTR